MKVFLTFFLIKNVDFVSMLTCFQKLFDIFSELHNIIFNLQTYFF
jgi:hypothetical protein